MSIILAVILGLVMLGLDIITKMLVLGYFEGTSKTVSVIDGVLSFCYRGNDGAGFSILSGHTEFLVIFTIIALIAILFLLIKGTYRSHITNFGFCLIFFGGIGNLIDRLFRNGVVVDFISFDFIDFPVFNVADICVTVGAGLVILYFLIEVVKEYKAKGKPND